jgi:hypothetical protein
MLTRGGKLLDFIEKAATDRKKSRGRRWLSVGGQR